MTVEQFVAFSRVFVLFVLIGLVILLFYDVDII